MKISLVTISFNQARYLEHAIKSVLDQGYPELEYILVDPGSTDGSRDIIERYRPHVTHIILEPDKGPADGLNKGFAHAGGSVFGYLNSDDMLLPGALARVAAAFQAHPDADLVYGHGYVIGDNGDLVARCRSDRFNLRRSAYGNSVIMQQAAFWRREAFDAVHGFNAANRLCWDGEFWIDLALAGRRFRRINEYWACFRTHQDSITQKFHMAGGTNLHPYAAEQKRILEKALGRKKHPSDAIAAVATRIEKWLVDPVNLWLRLVRWLGFAR